jgi:phosphatidylglycerophosphate synthase
MDAERSITGDGAAQLGELSSQSTRPERVALRRRALAALLTVGVGMLLAAWLMSRQLQLSGIYAPKSLVLFTAAALLILPGLSSQHPFARLGAANVVTLVRGALVALLAALIGERAAVVSMVATVIATTVILLDGGDGWLARRTHMSSAFGARFDMEVDAALVAVLAVLAWRLNKVGIWVLLSGAMRYLFAAAAALIPLLRRPLPPSYRAKTIAVIQMLALVVAVEPASPVALADTVAATALFLLTLSFLLDVIWLARHAV